MSTSLSTDKYQSVDFLCEITKNDFNFVMLVGNLSNLSVIKDLVAKQRPDLYILDVYIPHTYESGGFEKKMLSFLFEGYKGVVMVSSPLSPKEEVFKITSIEDFEKLSLPRKLREAILIIFNKHITKTNGHHLINFNIDELPERPVEEKLVLKTNEMIYAIKTKDIIKASADNNYTNFHLVDGSKILVTKGLKSFEEKLLAHGFLRVHQSFLVNIIHIKAFVKKSGELILSNNSKIPVAKKRKTEVLDYINNLGF